MPTRILHKESLIPGKTSKLVLDAPEIARKGKPGHFVMLRMTPTGERIPLTIADTDAENGSITIVNELLISTDDGSYGHKGLVTDLLRDRLEKDKSVFEVVAVGPVPMMAAVAETTRPFGVKTTVSLNPIMVDGIGMCGACRVSVGGKTKFACVDGPEFDGHEVDFPELRRRLAAYREQEKVSIDDYQRTAHGN